MPFGLKNTPATFQRLMNKLFREYLNDFAAVYIDDIMIYSKTFEEHLHHIESILKKLKEANIMLKLKKCKWGDRNVEYLGLGMLIGLDQSGSVPRQFTNC